MSVRGKTGDDRRGGMGDGLKLHGVGQPDRWRSLRGGFRRMGRNGCLRFLERAQLRSQPIDLALLAGQIFAQSFKRIPAASPEDEDHHREHNEEEIIHEGGWAELYRFCFKPEQLPTIA